ncbi:MFS transporter [Salinicoccus halodurans]|uniref:MFS transporter n=1 Tax=Salinicoccus halodurans TaxID=407035 RepID=A0A0F7HN23_9STAP|nr:MFS transporter [Salinicoccus halodurans]AKG74542.1 MFS transporter [Salinicoccus halodurans]SFK90000.1 Major Facilitator Superfamily protein [Salinicoccus halodurans]
MKLESFRARFIILSAIVCISGFSQGMLLPLISFIFENREVSAAINGLHASGLYIGVLLSALFIEAPLRKYGFRPMIITGGAVVGLSLLAFPLLDTIWLWFILRLIVGIGDNALHFSTQTWLTQSTPHHKLGKVIAFYGLFFSAGFMVGPKVSELVTIWEPLPFIVSGALTMMAWPLIFLLKDAENAKPEDTGVQVSIFNTLKNFKDVLLTSWVAFLFPMLYGVLEASLNSNFPVFAVRNDFELSEITWILPAFSFGAILLQVPIGGLGDKIGRAKLINILLLFGAATFLMMEVFSGSFVMLLLSFMLAGIFVGSMYSLGISYMTDITPRSNLPAGNLMAGIMFSLGSISGPIIGGAIIGMTGGAHYFTFFALVILIIIALNIVFTKRRHTAVQ